MKSVFLDGASNTPMDKKVIKAMKPYLKASFMGNSASPHDFGIKAAMAIEKARQQVADAVCVKTNEVFFTSGATESNNWVIHSVAEQQLKTGMKRPRIICSSTEHSSILNACKNLMPLGFEVTFVETLSTGDVDDHQVSLLIDERVCLVCVMAVNNELGVRNNLTNITKIAREKGALTLIDCTQAMSLGGHYVEIGNIYPNGDYLSFSAHKLYGPTGVGCLIKRASAPLSPMLFGGSQEQGKRGGTSNTAGIVGLGAAIQLLHSQDYLAHFSELCVYTWKKIEEQFPNCEFNVVPDHPNILSLTFAGELCTKNLAAALATKGICVSAGSACDSEHDDIEGFNPSHVLQAIKLPENIIRNTIRISFIKTSTKKDIDRLFNALNEIKGDIEWRW